MDTKDEAPGLFGAIEMVEKVTTEIIDILGQRAAPEGKNPNAGVSEDEPWGVLESIEQVTRRLVCVHNQLSATLSVMRKARQRIES